jgi:hypothetical protein
MSETKPKSNAGRKRLSEKDDTVSATFRMTKGQRDKIRSLGGAKWIRNKVDREKNTNPNG